MAKNKTTEAEIESENGAEKTQIEKADKVHFTGEIIMRERIDEDTDETRYSVAILMNNPFADLFEGGAENEYNRQIFLGFRESQGKVRAQFMYQAKRVLETCDKIEFSGFARRKKFFDLEKRKRVKYIAISIKSPFNDGFVNVTIPRADTLGLFEMFADERLKPLK